MSVSTDHLYNLDQRFRDGDDHSALSLWVPSERISLHRIAAPTAPLRKWPSLIPWMLEERILGSVDEVHFALGERFDDGSIDVYAVDRSDMREWQRVAENAGVVALRMLPDYLALPWDQGRISVGWHAGRCLVRHSASQGFAAQPALAWAMVERLMPPKLSRRDCRSAYRMPTVFRKIYASRQRSIRHSQTGKWPRCRLQST